MRYVKYDLVPGEKVRIIAGEELRYMKPYKVEFVKEYSNHLTFRAYFNNNAVIYGIRSQLFSVSKASLWCGDTVIKKASNHSFVGRGNQSEYLKKGNGGFYLEKKTY